MTWCGLIFGGRHHESVLIPFIETFEALSFGSLPSFGTELSFNCQVWNWFVSSPLPFSEGKSLNWSCCIDRITVGTRMLWKFNSAFLQHHVKHILSTLVTSQTSMIENKEKGPWGHSSLKVYMLSRAAQPTKGQKFSCRGALKHFINLISCPV